MKFRKKPVVIEAWRFDPSLPPTDVPAWIPLAWFAEEIIPEPRFAGGSVEIVRRRGSPVIQVPTLEGVMTARIGDWIIKGVKDEVYPCRPDIFEATYESADSADGGK